MINYYRFFNLGLYNTTCPHDTKVSIYIFENQFSYYIIYIYGLNQRILHIKLLLQLLIYQKLLLCHNNI